MWGLDTTLHHMMFATICLDHGLVTGGYYGNVRPSSSGFGRRLLEFVSWLSPLTAFAVCGALKRSVPWFARPGLRPNLWSIHCLFVPERESGKKCARCPESSTFRSTRQ
jgi:hypothetical protein